MKQKVKSEISDSAAKTLKLQTKFVIIKMPVRQVIHSYLSSFLYPASTGSYFAKTRQRKEKNKKYLKESVIRCRNHLTLEITEQASASFLKTLLGVISNAQ